MFRRNTAFANSYGNMDMKPVKMTWLKLLAHWSDNAFRIPGTRFRIGWDGLIGLVPFVGNVAGTLFSAYLVREAARMGVSRKTLWKMSFNVVADALIGAVPIVGNLADFAWKANAWNIHLMEQELSAGVTKPFMSGSYTEAKMGTRNTQPETKPRREPVTIDAS